MTRLLLTISFCFFTIFALFAQNTAQLRAEVYFSTDKHELTSESCTVLEDLKNNLKQHPSYSIFVKGNTDADGSNRYNQLLSEKRVASVKVYLTKLGIPADAFNVVAVGEEEPIADNVSNDGKQKNRRVDIIVNYSASGSSTISSTIPNTPLSTETDKGFQLKKMKTFHHLKMEKNTRFKNCTTYWLTRVWFFR
jgi:hypothetical protein